METELKDMKESIFTEPLITAGVKKKTTITTKKHIDEYFDKTFLTSYFEKDKSSKKKK